MPTENVSRKMWANENTLVLLDMCLQGIIPHMESGMGQENMKRCNQPKAQNRSNLEEKQRTIAKYSIKTTKYYL